MTDFRALCAELIDALDSGIPTARIRMSPLADRARAALAQPEPEGPTDDEWYALVDRAWDKYETIGNQGERFMYDSDFGNALDYVRKVLARWGNHRGILSSSPPPPSGEVAELVAWLRSTSSSAFRDGWPNEESTNLARAADLLERLSPPQPIPVSERLPGPEDCDVKGRCWVHQPVNYIPEAPTWQLLFFKYASATYGTTMWLPARALPVPSGDA